MIPEQDEGHDTDDLKPLLHGRPRNEALMDHGHNQISVGDDPLLKRLIAKHGDRRY